MKFFSGSYAELITYIKMILSVFMPRDIHYLSNADNTKNIGDIF